MQFSPFNEKSVSLSLNTLEKRPKCVKNDLPKVIFVLNMRSKYRGEVRFITNTNFIPLNFKFFLLRIFWARNLLKYYF